MTSISEVNCKLTFSAIKIRIENLIIISTIVVDSDNIVFQADDKSQAMTKLSFTTFFSIFEPSENVQIIT